MLPHRYKLILFQCEALGSSDHTPACEDLQLIAVFEGADGRRIERRKTILAYPRIMADPEQFPMLITGELSELMRDVRRA